MAAPLVIRSVGIDIGTTTTQVIFSRLEVVNRAAISQVPNYEFSRRDITYISPAVFTPLDDAGNVDETALGRFIFQQYAAAGERPEDVRSGAIIITGETSKAKNARPAILALAERLGDFIVASAGPHLESVIAGQGSGAADISRQESSRILNIDIGGGTSNYAVFEAGRVVDTACLNVGGHLAELAPDGRLRRLHPPAALVCAELFGDGARFSPSSVFPVAPVAERMAQLIHEIAIGEPSGLARKLLLTESLKPGWRYDGVCLSGGVGDCYYHPASVPGPFAFGDMGPALALALSNHPGFSRLPRREPRQTLRATVIGAGAYTLSLSGSTIWVDSRQLPLRNLPVAHPALAWADATPEKLARSWQEASQRMDLDPADAFALGLPPDMPVGYREVSCCVDALGIFLANATGSPWPLIIVARQDVGKVLGMLVQPALKGRELAVIDEVQTHPGDYLDIGAPLAGGDIVPVTVKSLAFPA